MIFELCNVGVERMIVRYSNQTIMLQPCQSVTISSDLDNVDVELFHIKNDKLNIVWYLLNEFFTLEQMRTVLVVDGEYTIKPIHDNALVKVKSYEYVFDKNTSYQTFVFSKSNCFIKRKNLKVANRQGISKKAKFLYLFGGDKILFPITGVALLSFFIKILFSSHIPAWFLGMTFITIICFIFYFLKYKKSLEFLNKVLEEKYILEYLSSERKEYRKLSDELIQKHIDTNSRDEVFW